MSFITPTSDAFGEESEFERTKNDVANLMAAVNKLNNPSNSNIIQTKTATIINDGSANKALIGYQSAVRKWGIFSAKDGKDVTTITDLNDFEFNSSQNTLRLAKVVDIPYSFTFGAVTGPVNGGTDNSQQTTVAHGLNFIPVVIWTVIVPGGAGNSSTISAGSLVFQSYASNGAQTVFWSLNVNATNLIIGNYRRFWVADGTTLNALGTQNSIVRAYLLQQTATT